MKIGLLACSSNTGLGYQTRDFYKFMKPDKVLIYDISEFNKMPTDHSWAFQPTVVQGFPTDQDMEWLADGMDVVFCCETPLNYHLYEYARKIGVKTVQQYNYEFLDYFKKSHLPVPDVLASPSLWGIERVKSLGLTHVEHWPVPVDTKQIPFRERKEVKTLVHIVGRPAAMDRNGTLTFIELAKKLGDQYKYKVFLQRPEEKRAVDHFEPVRKALVEVESRLWGSFEIIEDTAERADMYKWGDIFVLPRRYGGLCLPMWEALAAGMPVVMPNISPNHTILPEKWLVEASIQQSLQAHTSIPVYDTDLNDLISTINELKSGFDGMSKFAHNLAENMSWEVQKPKYLERFKKLCE